MQVNQLDGAPYARGLQLGRATKEAVARSLQAWLDSLARAGVADPVRHVTRMVAATSFLDAVETHAPDLLAELRGFAHGAAQPFELLFAAQLMDEEWAWRAQLGLDPGTREKCSSLAVRTDDGMLAGQNMDLGAYTDGHQVVHRIARDGDVPAALVFSLASMIALMGVNACGIALCVNSLPQLPAAQAGLPVAFLIRKLLQARDLGEAVAMVQSLPHATGQHYLLADAAAFRSFEASPERVAEYLPQDRSRLLHTNHVLAGTVEAALDVTDSTVRLQALERHAGQGRVDLAGFAAALCSRDDRRHPVSREFDPAARASALSGDVTFTTGSMICALPRRGGAIDCRFSAGPPSARPYAAMTLPHE